MTGRLTDRLRKSALWVLFAPFLFLSMIPQGVMPTRDAAGVLMLVICTGAGMVEVAVDPVTLEPIADHATDAPDLNRDHCAWAHAQMPLAFVATAALPRLTGGLTRQLAPPPPPVLLALTRATGLPPATGPPPLI